MTHPQGIQSRTTAGRTVLFLMVGLAMTAVFVHVQPFGQEPAKVFEVGRPGEIQLEPGTAVPKQALVAGGTVKADDGFVTPRLKSTASS